MHWFGQLIIALLVLTHPCFAAEITLSCGAVGKEIELCRTGAKEWARKSGHSVRIVSAPNSSTDRLGLYLQLLAARSPDIDVFVVDTTWPGIIGGFFVDLKPLLEESYPDKFFPAFIRNNTVEDKLVALPWYMDAGVLYYRQDLLSKYGKSIPETWEELTETAKVIQAGERKAGKRNFWGFVFQGRAYEGLTCNALEWIYSSSGGRIVADSGEITINNANAVKALNLAASWISGISPRGVLNYTEEEARGVFQAGNAAFMRNWPYAWQLGNAENSEIKGKFSITVLPKGEPAVEGSEGQNAATLGGWSLAISKYSPNVEIARDLILYLASENEQKRRAKEGGFHPTLEALYQDEQLRAQMPYLEKLHEVFLNAVPRPSDIAGRKYSRVSAEFWEAVHQTLSSGGEAKEKLRKLEKKLVLISRKGKW